MMTAVTVNTKSPRHKWPHDGEEGYRHIARCDDGNERIEKQCRICGIIRITVIPPNPTECWHEWKRGKGKPFQMESTPPCIGGVETLREYSEVKAL